MPELPEVEMVRRELASVCGRRIVDLEVVHPSILSSTFDSVMSVKGRRIIGLCRRGKQIFIVLDEEILTLHLGMTGEISLGERSEGRHVAVRIFLDDGRVINYLDPRRFGAFGHASSVATFVSQHGLGKDILRIDREEFADKLKASRRAIKVLLLDQSIASGIGNLYADETLFQAGIAPSCSGKDLEAMEAYAIWRCARMVLRRSLSVGTDFSRLPSGYLLRDRTAGHACPRCRRPLQAVTIGGRTSIFCAGCQRS